MQGVEESESQKAVTTIPSWPSATSACPASGSLPQIRSRS